MKVLGIETSCDETSCAVVRDGREVLSNIISSSASFHKKYGGVIPEIASRFHLEKIDSVAKEALSKAKIDLKKIDLIAVTEKPGLFGSLLVGIVFAEGLSIALNKPIVKVDHIHAHLYAPWLASKLNFPYIGLVVSGGHTSLFKVKDFNKVELISNTLDDAAGEAFDKAAKILSLGYPGGPFIDKLAKTGNKKAVKFSCEGPRDSFDFSFSGIKTSLLYKMNDKKFRKAYSINDIAASFQAAIVDTIARKTFLAAEKFRAKAIVLGGGVVANSYLREVFEVISQTKRIKVFLPETLLCTDNAAIIAGLGYRLYKQSKRG